MKKKSINSLLVEIMIAVLCFGLASIVILQTFVVAHQQSVLASEITEALLSAQNLADIVSVTDDENLSGMLATEQDEDGNYIFPQVGSIQLVLSLQEEEMAAGTMRRGAVAAVRNDETLFTLPCSHYTEGVSK